MQFPKKTSEYEELKELTVTWDLVYGPIQSRRLGMSLGINLLNSGDKICSFDCPYCEVGRTTTKMSDLKSKSIFSDLAEVEKQLRAKLVELSKNEVTLDSISFVGNGEPTLHPEFAEAVAKVKEIRNQLMPTAALSILTNGSTLDNAKVCHAMNILDERMVKLDAGNDNMLKKINGPITRVTISKLINGTTKLNNLILQSFFVQGAIDNTKSEEVDDWIEVVGMIRPKLVHLYTLDRVPPVSGLIPAPRQKLKEILARLEKRTQIEGVVFS